MRRLVLALIAIGVLAFLGVSALLARAFSADGAERSAIVALITAEGRGDGAAVAAQLYGCSQRPGCRARADALSVGLRRAGKTEILALDPSTGFSLASTLGIARVAWNTAQDRLPVVQCVQVRRAGNVLRGLHIELLKVGPRVKSDSDCPPTM